MTSCTRRANTYSPPSLEFFLVRRHEELARFPSRARTFLLRSRSSTMRRFAFVNRFAASSGLTFRRLLSRHLRLSISSENWRSIPVMLGFPCACVRRSRSSSRLWSTRRTNSSVHRHRKSKHRPYLSITCTTRSPFTFNTIRWISNSNPWFLNQTISSFRHRSHFPHERRYHVIRHFLRSLGRIFAFFKKSDFSLEGNPESLRLVKQKSGKDIHSWKRDHHVIVDLSLTWRP